MNRKSLGPAPPANYSLIQDIATFQSLNSDLQHLNSHLIGLQKLHDNFTQFNESVGALIYGLNLNAWCTEFSEAPNDENFANKYKVDQLNLKIRQVEEKIARLEGRHHHQQQQSGTDDSTNLTILSEDSFVMDPVATTTIAAKNRGFKKPHNDKPGDPVAKISKGTRRQSRIPTLANGPRIGSKSARPTGSRIKYPSSRSTK
ncbi:hypothetical protein DASC09_021610 [Saccharomycopsis crataegensis]|uniref:DASH complex subunit DAM1 n=1 Tax=Saccharomycopsis crataegensis TaxID=43959 RepID=A0AAV5QJH7_9ASCO|nr:hypothetical protein DASC09_021610 [Saccharomycopsis crataegensis]